MPATSKAKKMPRGRKDPVFRPVDQGQGRFRVRNADPNYKYVGVYTNNSDISVDSYLDMGWEPVEASEGGAVFGHGRNQKEGEEVVASGHLLMRMPKDEWEAMQQRSQDYADYIDDQLHDKRGARQAIRGIGDGYLDAENDSEQEFA